MIENIYPEDLRQLFIQLLDPEHKRELIQLKNELVYLNMVKSCNLKYLTTEKHIWAFTNDKVSHILKYTKFKPSHQTKGELFGYEQKDIDAFLGKRPGKIINAGTHTSMMIAID